MRSGNLKHKIVIQTFTESQNDFGEVAKGWTNFKSAYASVTPLSAKEFFKAGTHAEVSHKIELRYISGIKSKMRVVYDSRIFEIESVLNIREANKTLHLICTEVV
ncbi:MAG: phage head closure protein [Sulfurimonas sp.]|nr:phage head closure protein [Sulfurimonas sp.]